MNRTLLQSGKDDWETPQALYDVLDAEFKFTVDVCANPQNAKCRRFFSPEQNGLLQDWRGETAWCNPPYSTKLQDAFVRKAYESTRDADTTVVALLPARTDTKRFHEYILGKAEIRFLPGRITFVGAENPAPFPSMIVVWRSRGVSGL